MEHGITACSCLKALPYVTISSTLGFNVAKIASARASSTISLTKSLRVAGPLKLLLLDTCVSYQADTSRIVHQSHTATCLAILIHNLT